MTDKKILDLMVEQHALLDALFASFKSVLAVNEVSAKESFDELLKEIKRHFFIEEQAIFNLLPWKDPEVLEMVNGLKREHVVLTNQLESVEKDLNEIKSVEADYLALLKRHVAIEEKMLYPMLDQKLNEEEKKLIVSRINELPLQ